MKKPTDCVILSGAAIGSAVEESSAYQRFDTEKILRLHSVSLRMTRQFGSLHLVR